MTKYLLLGVGVLVVVVVAMVMLAQRPTKPAPESAASADPLTNHLALLADTAKQACLVGTDDTTSAAVTAQIELIKGVKASANAETRAKALRGAIDFPEKLKAPEMAAARECMSPWAEQMRKLAQTAMAKP